jgi:hypothetical protein
MLLAAVVLGCLPLTAQGLGMELKWLKDTPDGLGAAQLTNTRKFAATAYMVQFEHVEGDAVTPLTPRAVEAVPRGGAALEPGQSKEFTAPKAPAKGVSANNVRVVCAIFADGSTMGDELCVKRFLDKRRQLLREDIPHVLGFLKAALAQPKPDLKSIIDDMDAVITERSGWAKEQTPFSPILAEARAHATVKTSLSLMQGRSKDKALITETLQKLIDLLESWRGDLESSKPELGQ